MSAQKAIVQKTNSEIDALKHLTPEELVQAKQLAQGLDVRDPLAVLSFGTKWQTNMSAMSDPILKAVRTKDAGAAVGVTSRFLHSTVTLIYWTCWWAC